MAGARGLRTGRARRQVIRRSSLCLGPRRPVDLRAGQLRLDPAFPVPASGPIVDRRHRPSCAGHRLRLQAGLPPLRNGPEPPRALVHRHSRGRRKVRTQPVRRKVPEAPVARHLVGRRRRVHPRVRHRVARRRPRRRMRRRTTRKLRRQADGHRWAMLRSRERMQRRLFASPAARAEAQRHQLMCPAVHGSAPAGRHLPRVSATQLSQSILLLARMLHRRPDKLAAYAREK